MAARTGWIVCTAVGVALALPGAAGAAVKSVNMGTDKAQQKALQASSADVNAYFPSSVAVHVGDSVRFVPTSFHSVHFFGRSGKLTPTNLVGDTAVAGVLDAAGAPFFFNGLPSLVTNGALFAPRGFGKTFATNGTKEIESGFPVAPKLKPMTVRFTKAGLFTYNCDLHPGMKGSVRVSPTGRIVPPASVDAKRVKAQAAKALAVAKAFKSIAPPANTVDVGFAGKGGVELFGFAPAQLTVPVGTTVTFRVPAGSTETHTATTGPGNPDKEPKSYLGAIASGNDDQRLGYPSDPPPAGPAALSPLLHGNGFWNSGGLDAVPGPLPASGQVTFAAAGTYEFYCLIHTFMHGTITVQ